jgi:peptidoglycan/LPS O-acetylase OafA/YrhL
MPFFSKLYLPQPVDRDNQFDLLRLLAAFLVFFSHCFALCGQKDREPLASLQYSLGAVAVDAFFVISGFLICQSYAYSRSFITFVQNRLLRLLPALGIFIFLAVFALGPWITSLSFDDYMRSDDTRRFFRTLLLFKAHYGLPGVFSDQPSSAVNGSLWTLIYEFRIYFLAPLLLLLFSSYQKLLKFLLAILFTSFLLLEFVYPSATYSPIHYYIKFSYLFTYGTMCNLYRFRLIGNKKIFLISCLILIVSALTTFFLPIYYVIFPFLIIHISLKPQNAFVKKLVNYGDLSYGVYLYSFPIQQLFRYYNGAPTDPYVMFFSTLVPTLCCSWLSYWYIEKPALSLKKTSLLMRNVSA